MQILHHIQPVIPAQSTSMMGRNGTEKQPYELVMPHGMVFPVILSSPHSGTYLPPAMLERTQLPVEKLRSSEDCFVDELFNPATKLGLVMIKSVYSRAFVDLNREPWELDQRMFSTPLPRHVNGTTPRVLSGLGTIPRVVADGTEIYREKLDKRDALERISLVYMPYQRALANLVERAVEDHGTALLLDCHSMPATANGSTKTHGLADIVLGDRFGTTASQELVDMLEHHFRQQGFSCRRNRPYAGGFITETFGIPRRNRHAIQIEVNRSLYMNEARLTKHEGFAELQKSLTAIMSDYLRNLCETGYLQASRRAAE
jgi:N-formylglutamate amidohydrolase